MRIQGDFIFISIILNSSDKYISHEIDNLDVLKALEGQHPIYGASIIEMDSIKISKSDHWHLFST